jgi:fatty acid desaturase
MADYGRATLPRRAYNPPMTGNEPYAHAPIDRREMRELRRLSDWPGSWHLALHLAALLAAGCLVALAPDIFWRIPAQALEGAIFIFFFSPLHETIHRTAFRNRRFNDWAAAVIGFLLILPADYFRFFHFCHHRYTQDPLRDPELATPKPSSLGQWLVVVTGLPVWRTHVMGVLRHAAGKIDEPYLTAVPARRVTREARIHLGLYTLVAAVSLALRSTTILEFWVVPALLGQPWLRLYLLAEHTGCPLVPDMLANSRTTLTNGIVRFFAWNMPYHAEHHAFPAVPFHALPRLHQRLAPALKVVAPGYIAAQRSILKGLKRQA